MVLDITGFFERLSFSLDKTMLWGFLVLIPYIIIYLTKPKPQKKTIPSLMFLMNVQGKMRKNAILNKILRNFLFFLQLAILSILALALTSPVIDLSSTFSADNVVIVIDGSASMQASESQGSSKSRFEEALVIAEENIGRNNGIVLAENSPQVFLKDGSSKEAKKIISDLKPRATSTNLGDALIQAEELLGNKRGKIVLISDFTSNQGSDAVVARRRIISNGNNIDFIAVGEALPNIGIVDIKFDKHNARVYVKNYFSQDKTITLVHKHEGKEINSTGITLGKSEMGSVGFSLITGKNMIEIKGEDSFSLDDSVNIIVPEEKKIRTLIITNLRNKYLISALRAIKDVELSVGEPPTLPEINHDIIIIDRVNLDLVLSGTYPDIESLVKKGSSLIVMAQDDLWDMDIQEMLPVSPSNVLGRTSIITRVENEFTKGTDFGTAGKHLNATVKDTSLVLVESQDGTPLIVQNNYQDGQVLYYGIYDSESDFKDSVQYPLFWYDLTGHLSGRKELSNFNLKAGTILSVDGKKVKTPTHDLKAQKILLDEIGYYEISQTKISVNLLDPIESDLTAVDTDSFEKSTQSDNAVSERHKNESPLVFILLILVFIGMIVELIYLKYRGDI